MSDAVSFFFLVQTATLVVASVLLAYPVVAYARNVAYTRGLVLLSTAFVVVTATYVAAFSFHAPVVSAALDLLAASLAALGTWEFARPFVRTGDEMEVADPETESTATREASGGFESAGDD